MGIKLITNGKSKYYLCRLTILSNHDESKDLEGKGEIP